MLSACRRVLVDVYERSLEREITNPPSHVAVIQDGNRRFARQRGEEAPAGHRAGADTTEEILQWCRDLDVDELTLYAFSTENFNRPPHEREELFDLITSKLHDLADADDTHREELRIRAIGELDQLPPRVRDAVDYAEERTAGYDRFRLNVALAYGGRAELLTAARDVGRAVAEGRLTPDDVDLEEIERRLYDADVRDVDLIIRTGGDERTSNFLPWHANGNEAAVYFCTPFWPEFAKRDFLRAIRTYQYREESWRRTRIQRATALLRAFGERELPRARSIISSMRDAPEPDELGDGMPDPAD